MSELQMCDGTEEKVAGLLFGTVSNGGLPPDAPKSEDERRSRWIKSWIVDFRFGTWEHCFYCGQIAGVSDHVIPHAFYSVEKRGHTD